MIDFEKYFHSDATCGSCDGPLDCHRDAICVRCSQSVDIHNLEGLVASAYDLSKMANDRFSNSEYAYVAELIQTLTRLTQRNTEDGT